MLEDWLKCSAPECSQFGVYVFRVGDVAKRACGEHRARGEAWFAKRTALPAADAPLPAPVQGSLL